MTGTSCADKVNCTMCIKPGEEHACIDSKCQVVFCPPGRADCNKNAADGCEVFLYSSQACRKTCDSEPVSCQRLDLHQEAACVEGECINWSCS